LGVATHSGARVCDWQLWVQVLIVVRTAPHSICPLLAHLYSRCCSLGGAARPIVVVSLCQPWRWC
jgi:hypothetical protein